MVVGRDEKKKVFQACVIPVGMIGPGAEKDLKAPRLISWTFIY